MQCFWIQPFWRRSSGSWKRPNFWTAGWLFKLQRNVTQNFAIEIVWLREGLKNKKKYVFRGFVPNCHEPPSPRPIGTFSNWDIFTLLEPPPLPPQFGTFLKKNVWAYFINLVHMWYKLFATQVKIPKQAQLCFRLASGLLSFDYSWLSQHFWRF